VFFINFYIITILFNLKGEKIMKRKTKTLGARIVSSLLVLGMVFSACPVTTYADSDEFENVTVDENSDEVVVVLDEDNTDPNVDSIPTDENLVEEEIVEDTVEPPETTNETEITTETNSEVTTETSSETTTEITTEVTEENSETTTETSETSETTDTTEISTENTEEVTTEESSEETTEETTEEEVEEIELVVFDHYFTEINESLVQTPDLLIQTNDPSIFTKNTNVVSNYDDVYVISCSSVEEARFVYSYYVDKVSNITDMSNVMSIATEDVEETEEVVEDVADLDNLNEGDDAIANLDSIEISNYSGYIALIDTGANADANFSVVGDDTSDSNGHGTQMLNYIKEENPNAKVMSIKVFNGSSTSAADVYAGIKLAIDSNVSVINLSLVGANIEKNAIVKDAIQEAIDKGIVVIGAAGNYNTNAKSYIPGCIDSVITVGAANDNGTKYSSSNFNADIYVVATSTSEASARYTGMYTANNTENDRVFTTLLSEDDVVEDTEEDTTETDGEVVEDETTNDDAVNVPFEDFYPQALAYSTLNLGEITQTAAIFTPNTNKTEYHSGVSYTETQAGYGTINVNSLDHSTDLYKSLSSKGISTIEVECSGHNPSDPTNSSKAKSIHSGSVNIQATYTTTGVGSDGKVYANWNLLISEDNTYNVNWYSTSESHTWNVSRMSNTVNNNAYIRFKVYVDGELIYENNVPDYGSVTNDVGRRASENIENRIKETAYGGVRNVSITGLPPDSIDTTKSGTATISYLRADHSQVFTRSVSAWQYAKINLSVTKRCNPDSNKVEIVNGNPNYSLAGTQFYVCSTNQNPNPTPIKDKYNNSAIITINSNGSSNVIELDSSVWGGKTVYLYEVSVGKGYILPEGSNRYTAVTLPMGGDKNVTVNNDPVDDPPTITIRKANTENTEGVPTGLASLNNAIYTVEQYYTESDLLAGTNKVRTWKYATDANGNVYFRDAAYLLADQSDDVYNKRNEITFPVGYYKIYESAVPSEDGVNTGYLKSDIVYVAKVTQTSDTLEAQSELFLVKNGTLVTIPTENIDEKGNVIDPQEPNNALKELENEKWLKIGVNKVDRDRNNLSTITSGAQGSASYENAIYLVCSANHNVLDNTDISVNHLNSYSFSNTALSTTISGVECNATALNRVSLSDVIWVDGEPLYIKTDANGYGETSVELPYGSANSYYLIEVAAPEGFKINPDRWYIDETWTTGENGVTVPGVTDIAGVKHPVASTDDGKTIEEVYRGTINIKKVDAHSNGATNADARVEGIRYAVVLDVNNGVTGEAQNSIIWPQTKNSSYSGVTPKTYEPGQVVAVLTLDANGLANIKELPYASYTVYELREDAQVQAGQVYSSANLGTSKYANSSYLYSDEMWGSTITEEHTSNEFTVTNVPIVVEEDGAIYSANYQNYVKMGKITIRKFDKETDTQINQGSNEFEGIRYAVVNRSADKVSYATVTETGEEVVVKYDVNDVVAILTLNENGYAEIENMPYGTYEVCELRMDATITPGETYDGSNKLGTSIYANEYYLYADDIITYLINSDPIRTGVATMDDEIHEAGYVFETKYSNAPVRGDLEFYKYDMNGRKMPYIPFKVTLLDENGNAALDKDGNPISHIIITDENGFANTHSRSKDISNLNTLDQYYVNGVYNGPLDANAAQANIWFGDIDAIVNENPAYICEQRGACLYGSYLIEELLCDANKGHAPMSIELTVSQNKQLASSDRILIDFDIWMDSEATDGYVGTNTLSVGFEDAPLNDEVRVTHIVTDTTYKLETEAYAVRESDGAVISLGKEDSEEFMCVYDDNGKIVVKQGDEIVGRGDDFVITEAKIKTDVHVDTRNLEEYDYVALVDRLYMKDGAQTTDEEHWTMIQTHNEDFSVESQRLYIPKFNSKATNITTNSQIGSLDPITEASDKFIYENFGDNDYFITVQLVGDDGQVLNDVNGNPCEANVTLFTSERFTTFSKHSELDGTLYGPSSGECLLSDLGIDTFVIDKTEDITSAYFVVTIKTAITVDGVPQIKPLFEHNINRDVDSETIKWLQIETFAGSVTGYQGVIPNDIQAELVDIIEYTNCAETVDVLIEGKVVVREDVLDKNGNPVLNADGTPQYKEGEVVAENSVTKTLSVGEGTTNISYIFDSSKYTDKTLVVYENVYIEVNGQKTLVATHEDLYDTNQTVRIPEIKTELMTVHNGNGFKVISQVYEEVTVTDYVTYTNVKPNESWVLTATIKDGKTGNTVLDADGNPVTKDHTFTPTEENGVEPVEITFTRLLTETSWEEDESWVMFEDLKSNSGTNDFTYATHNDINDENQTILHPKFRTTAVEADSAGKMILADVDQTVIDKVELKNFDTASGLAKGDKFTLKIVPIIVETEEPLLKEDGTPYSNTKTFEWNGQTEETISITFDATGLDGKTIVFYEYLYYGESTNDEDMVLKEDVPNNWEQSVVVPKIHTNATDKDTNTKTLAVNGTIVDEVSLEHILPNTEYTIETKVVDKTLSETNGELVFVKDKDGKDIVATVPYTSPSANSTTNVTYKCGDCEFETDTLESIEEHLMAETHSTFANVETVETENTVSTKVNVEIDMSTAVDIAGHDIVVYEYIYYNGTLCAKHTDINDLDQTIYVPGCKTTASDPVDNDNIIDGTSKTAKITDTVTYSNLIVGQEYTVVGNWVVKPKSTNKDLTLDKDYKYEYVKDADGNIVTSSVTFVAEEPNGTIDVEFTIDASKYAGKHLVAFESIYMEDVEMAIHADINDDAQTIIVPLKLHAQIAKADRANVTYFLKDAEITIFKKGVNGAPDTIAKDINGKDCVGMTDENGRIDFTVIYYSEDDQFYAMETKAPRGYQLCEDKFEIYPSGDREGLGTDLIKISVLDEIIIIPPKTGDNTPIIILVALLGIGIVGVVILFATRGKKKSDEENSDKENSNEETITDTNLEIVESEIEETSIEENSNVTDNDSSV
jgi:hypothetical protein